MTHYMLCILCGRWITTEDERLMGGRNTAGVCDHAMCRMEFIAQAVYAEKLGIFQEAMLEVERTRFGGWP